MVKKNKEELDLTDAKAMVKDIVANKANNNSNSKLDMEREMLNQEMTKNLVEKYKKNTKN